MSESKPTPRIAESLNDLRVGQVVAFINDEDHRQDDIFRVAFVDPPEAILKRTHNGWPRIAWQSADFHKPFLHLTILSDPPPEPVQVSREAFDQLADLVHRYGTEPNTQLSATDVARAARALVDEVRQADR